MQISEILDNLKVAQLNAMQRASVDAILHGRQDIVIMSSTGSGKTLAYMLPLVQLLNSQTDYVQALVLVPGRELAQQSTEVLRSMKCGIRACACYGGRITMDEHRMILQIRPHIIFATPGRINDHMKKGNFDNRHIKFLIIDEFDKCLEMGFQNEMKVAIDRLPKVERRILVSATDAEYIPDFVNIGQCRRIDFSSSNLQISERIKTYKVYSSTKDKLDTLSSLLRVLGKESSIIFLNHRNGVERTTDFLCNKGFSVNCFHGGMEQKMREDALYCFSNGSVNIFVCTDLGSRGLDIAGVRNVIHYHIPENKNSYVHRTGRTARWQAAGNTYFILAPEEHVPDYVNGIVEDFHIPQVLPEPALPVMTTLYIGKGRKDKISKGDIVGFLCKKGKLNTEDIGKIDIWDRYSYVAVKRTMANAVLNLLYSEKIKGQKTVVEPIKQMG